MIILRQKLYTRQDRQVIHELWKDTKGFRRLPKNWEKLNARDYFRLNKFSNGFGKAWTKGDSSQIDWNDFKTMMEHMELPETAKGGKHLIEKYTNPELIERYKSIKAHRAGLGREYKEQKKLKEEIIPLQKRRKQLEKKAEKVIEENGWNDEKTKNSKEWRQFREFDRDKHPDLFSKEKRHNDLASVLNQIGSKTPGKSFEARQIRLLEKESPRVEQELHKNEDLYKKLKSKLSHRTIIEDSYTSRAAGTSFTDFESAGRKRKRINIHRDHLQVPEILAHEEGHFKTLKRLGGKRKRSYAKLDEIQKSGRHVNSNLWRSVGNNPLAELVNEYSASREGLNLLKKSGADQEEISKARKGLAAAGKTYYRATLAGLRGEVENKFAYPML